MNAILIALACLAGVITLAFLSLVTAIGYMLFKNPNLFDEDEDDEN